MPNELNGGNINNNTIIMNESDFMNKKDKKEFLISPLKNIKPIDRNVNCYNTYNIIDTNINLYT